MWATLSGRANRRRIAIFVALLSRLNRTLVIAQPRTAFQSERCTLGRFGCVVR